MFCLGRGQHLCCTSVESPRGWGPGQKINQFARYVRTQFGESESVSERSRRCWRNGGSDQGRINGSGRDCLRRAESGGRSWSAGNFTAMTNDLRMLRRCLIGCHLRPVGPRRRKAKSGLVPAMESERDEKGRMMMRAKLIIPADVNDYEPLFLIFLPPFFPRLFLSLSLFFLTPRLFPPADRAA